MTAEGSEKGEPFRFGLSYSLVVPFFVGVRLVQDVTVSKRKQGRNRKGGARVGSAFGVQGFWQQRHGEDLNVAPDRAPKRV